MCKTGVMSESVFERKKGSVHSTILLHSDILITCSKLFSGNVENFGLINFKV